MTPIPGSGTSPVSLELGDLQGGILSAYGKRGFPRGRMLLFHMEQPEAGRAFVEALRPLVTAALRWPEHVPRPDCTLNIAFTFWGLVGLDVPTRTLRAMPDPFIDGMAARAPVLGDDVGKNRISQWDNVWQPAPSRPKPHILVMLNASVDASGSALPALEAMTGRVLAAAAATQGKLWLMDGHGGPEPRWQELSALFADEGNGQRRPSPMEHFGFVDAVGDPVFDGQYPGAEEQEKCRGQGAVDGAGNWRPLRTGEFILGWPNEGQEVAGAPMPLDFSRNGSFFAYRKLHQDIGAWDSWIETSARALGEAWGIAEPEQARATLKAKMAGRWPDGIPLVRAPDWASWKAAQARLPGMAASERMDYLTNFTFADDPLGERCPMTAHIRRANTRDMLDPFGRQPDAKKRMGSVLNDRRRILRRGLPYGARGTGDHGIVLLAYCTDLFRQFEFVQQQWMNYGLDFDAGNDSCPLVGAHAPGARFVIPAPDAKRPPFIAGGLPQFVATRGGDYFFQPSMTALRMIAQGMVDPT